MHITLWITFINFLTHKNIWGVSWSVASNSLKHNLQNLSLYANASKEEKRTFTRCTPLSSDIVDTIVSYLNLNNEEDLRSYVTAYSEIGAEYAAANAWSQGAYAIETVKLVSLNEVSMDLTVNIMKRSFFGKFTNEIRSIKLHYPFGEMGSAEKLKSCLMEMSRAQGLAASTASIYSIPVGSYSGLPQNLQLNSVPHSRLTRSYIYNGITSAVLEAINDPSVCRRMRVVCKVPELNPEFDTYRIGTLLELVRELSISLADDGRKVKICIQGSMGEGVLAGLPLALNGVMKIMQVMDWPEDYIGEWINFGQVGANFVEENDDVFIVVSPQSIVGASIHDSLKEMVNIAGSRPIILVNPNLKDRPSSGGVMGVRGRDERMKFEASFNDVYHFRPIYAASTLMFPIQGTVMKSGPSEPYVVYRRTELEKGGDSYKIMATFAENPMSEQINPLFKYLSN